MMKKRQRIAVLGDLHYEPELADVYSAARRQLLELKPERVFQLGDQGGYSHCGTWDSFIEGREFLQEFDLPYHTIIGNHDLEGPEYLTDAEAVTAWTEAFGLPRPYHSIDLGDALGICLSSTRFRDNPNCHHEVHLDRRQISWLRSTLNENKHRPTFIFSHAPPLGSGLRVLQSLHLKCPNAWLNHTDHPEQFIAIVKRHPQIKLWFSAHNHLGQFYADSVSRVGSCLFVHTGVIGDIARDPCRHSRVVDFDAEGFELSTFDHGSGSLIGNLRHDYRTGEDVVLAKPAFCDSDDHFGPIACPAESDNYRVGRSQFVMHRGMIVEYDSELRAPLGVVADRLTDPRITIRDGELHVYDVRFGVQVFKPNASGRFMRVYAPNPWRKQRLSA